MYTHHFKEVPVSANSLADSASFFDQADVVKLPTQQKKMSLYFSCYVWDPFSRSWNQFCESWWTFLKTKIKFEISECLHKSFARILHLTVSIWKDIWWRGYDQYSVHWLLKKMVFQSFVHWCLVFITKWLMCSLVVYYNMQLDIKSEMVNWDSVAKLNVLERCYLGYKYTHINIYIWVSGNCNIQNCF